MSLIKFRFECKCFNFQWKKCVWHFQAQKLLLRDGTLANFTIQSSSTLPTITLGLPANARVNTQLLTYFEIICFP